MLMLTCCDGATTAKAIELTRIDALSMQLHPGYKLAVRDVEICRGLLLLRPENVQLLGGEVADLVKIEEAKRKQHEMKYRPSYIPPNVHRDVLPATLDDENES